eukprot:1156931-Pelagomonas_calceolata.AAC.18
MQVGQLLTQKLPAVLAGRPVEELREPWPEASVENCRFQCNDAWWASSYAEATEQALKFCPDSSIRN